MQLGLKYDIENYFFCPNVGSGFKRFGRTPPLIPSLPKYGYNNPPGARTLKISASQIVDEQRVVVTRAVQGRVCTVLTIMSDAQP